MNKKRVFIVGVVAVAVFLMVGVKLSSGQVTLKSEDGKVAIKRDKVKEYDYLSIFDETNPTPKMYKEHLEDAMVYVLTQDDYEKVFDFYMDMEFVIGVQDEDLIKYLNYMRKCDEFKELKSLISYQERERVLDNLVKLLARSMKYNGL